MHWCFLACLAAIGCPSLVLFGQDSLHTVDNRRPVWEAYRQAAIHQGDTVFLNRFERSTEVYDVEHPNSEYARGFFAAAQLMKVEDITNILSKLESFLKWKAELETSITSNSDDPDLRLFRLSVQLNAPSLLNYFSDIDDDSDLIFRALNENFWTSDPEHEAFVRQIFTEFGLVQSETKDEQ